MQKQNQGENRLAFKYFSFIMAAFVAVLLISNIASTKIANFWVFAFDAGTLLFPLSYIFNDVLTEVYGYKQSRKVIWTGFVAVAFASFYFWIVGLMPPAAGWENQAAYDAILGIVPRIVLASLIAYFAGEFTNSFVLAKMKLWTKGKHLWARTIGSTIAGELVDTALFATIAFFGAIPMGLFIALVVSNYVFKVGVEVLLTPLTYKVNKEEKQPSFQLDVFEVPNQVKKFFNLFCQSF